MRQPDFSKFPTLATSRFILRQLSLSDVMIIYELRSNSEVAALTGKKTFTNLDEATSYIKKIENLIRRHECIFWGISYKNSTELLGTICLWNFDLQAEAVEIGYELLPQAQGKGIMSEAVSTVLEYGFGVMDVKSIVAFPSAQNPASVKLLEKKGFKLADDTYKHNHTNIQALRTYVISAPGHQ